MVVLQGVTGNKSTKSLPKILPKPAVVTVGDKPLTPEGSQPSIIITDTLNKTADKQQNTASEPAVTSSSVITLTNSDTNMNTENSDNTNTQTAPISISPETSDKDENSDAHNENVASMPSNEEPMDTRENVSQELEGQDKPGSEENVGSETSNMNLSGTAVSTSSECLTSSGTPLDTPTTYINIVPDESDESEDTYPSATGTTLTYSGSQAPIPSTMSIRSVEDSNLNNAGKSNHVCCVGQVKYSNTGASVELLHCNFCQYSTKEQTELVSHLLSHVFMCKDCNFKTFSRYDVVLHAREKHADHAAEYQSFFPYYLDGIQMISSSNCGAQAVAKIRLSTEPDFYSTNIPQAVLNDLEQIESVPENESTSDSQPANTVLNAASTTNTVRSSAASNNVTVSMPSSSAGVSGRIDLIPSATSSVNNIVTLTSSGLQVRNIRLGQLGSIATTKSVTSAVTSTSGRPQIRISTGAQPITLTGVSTATSSPSVTKLTQGWHCKMCNIIATSPEVCQTHVKSHHKGKLVSDVFQTVMLKSITQTGNASRTVTIPTGISSSGITTTSRSVSTTQLTNSNACGFIEVVEWGCKYCSFRSDKKAATISHVSAIHPTMKCLLLRRSIRRPVTNPTCLGNMLSGNNPIIFTSSTNPVSTSIANPVSTQDSKNKVLDEINKLTTTTTTPKTTTLLTSLLTSTVSTATVSSPRIIINNSNTIVRIMSPAVVTAQKSTPQPRMVLAQPMPSHALYSTHLDGVSKYDRMIQSMKESSTHEKRQVDAIKSNQTPTTGEMASEGFDGVPEDVIVIPSETVINLGDYFKQLRPNVFFCNICKVEMMLIEKMRSHALKEHIDDKYYECVYCQFASSLRYSMSSHLKSVHPDKSRKLIYRKPQMVETFNYNPQSKDKDETIDLTPDETDMPALESVDDSEPMMFNDEMPSLGIESNGKASDKNTSKKNLATIEDASKEKEKSVRKKKKKDASQVDDNFIFLCKYCPEDSQFTSTEDKQVLKHQNEQHPGKALHLVRKRRQFSCRFCTASAFKASAAKMKVHLAETHSENCKDYQKLCTVNDLSQDSKVILCRMEGCFDFFAADDMGRAALNIHMEQSHPGFDVFGMIEGAFSRKLKSKKSETNTAEEGAKPSILDPTVQEFSSSETIYECQICPPDHFLTRKMVNLKRHHEKKHSGKETNFRKRRRDLNCGHCVGGAFRGSVNKVRQHLQELHSGSTLRVVDLFNKFQRRQCNFNLCPIRQCNCLIPVGVSPDEHISEFHPGEISSEHSETESGYEEVSGPSEQPGKEAEQKSSTDELHTTLWKCAYCEWDSISLVRLKAHQTSDHAGLEPKFHQVVGGSKQSTPPPGSPIRVTSKTKERSLLKKNVIRQAENVSPPDTNKEKPDSQKEVDNASTVNETTKIKDAQGNNDAKDVEQDKDLVDENVSNLENKEKEESTDVKDDTKNLSEEFVLSKEQASFSVGAMDICLSTYINKVKEQKKSELSHENYIQLESEEEDIQSPAKTKGYQCPECDEIKKVPKELKKHWLEHKIEGISQVKIIDLMQTSNKKETQYVYMCAHSACFFFTKVEEDLATDIEHVMVHSRKGLPCPMDVNKRSVRAKQDIDYNLDHAMKLTEAKAEEHLARLENKPKREKKVKPVRPQAVQVKSHLMPTAEEVRRQEMADLSIVIHQESKPEKDKSTVHLEEWVPKNNVKIPITKKGAGRGNVQMVKLRKGWAPYGPYWCKICHKIVKEAVEMKKHLKKKHPDSVAMCTDLKAKDLKKVCLLYFCKEEGCNCYVRRLVALKYHMKIVHGTEMEDVQDNMEYSDADMVSDDEMPKSKRMRESSSDVDNVNNETETRKEKNIEETSKSDTSKSMPSLEIGTKQCYHCEKLFKELSQLKYHLKDDHTTLYHVGIDNLARFHKRGYHFFFCTDRDCDYYTREFKTYLKHEHLSETQRLLLSKWGRRFRRGRTVSELQGTDTEGSSENKDTPSTPNSNTDIASIIQSKICGEDSLNSKPADETALVKEMENTVDEGTEETFTKIKPATHMRSESDDNDAESDDNDDDDYMPGGDEKHRKRKKHHKSKEKKKRKTHVEPLDEFYTNIMTLSSLVSSSGHSKYRKSKDRFWCMHCPGFRCDHPTKIKEHQLLKHASEKDFKFYDYKQRQLHKRATMYMCKKVDCAFVSFQEVKVDTHDCPTVDGADVTRSPRKTELKSPREVDLSTDPTRDQLFECCFCKVRIKSKTQIMNHLFNVHTMMGGFKRVDDESESKETEKNKDLYEFESDSNHGDSENKLKKKEKAKLRHRRKSSGHESDNLPKLKLMNRKNMNGKEAARSDNRTDVVKTSEYLASQTSPISSEEEFENEKDSHPPDIGSTDSRECSSTDVHPSQARNEGNSDVEMPRLIPEQLPNSGPPTLQKVTSYTNELSEGEISDGKNRSGTPKMSLLAESANSRLNLEDLYDDISDSETPAPSQRGWAKNLLSENSEDLDFSHLTD